MRDLGRESFTWADLKAIVMHSPYDSALHRAMKPDEWWWSSPVMPLLAVQADALSWLVWAKTKDAQHGRGRPQPIPRPGVDGYADKRDTARLPGEDVRALLGAPRVAIE